MFSFGFLDKIRGVAIAAGAASLLALAGVFTLAASLAALFALWMPWPAALALSAVTFLATAAIAMWLSVRPDKDKGEKDDKGENSQMLDAASALVDMPLEVAKKLIAERPVAAVVLVGGLGLLIARRPQVALKVVDKILERFT